MALRCRERAPSTTSNSDINPFSKHTGYDRNGTRTYIRSMPRDESSIRLIADQGLVEQLGFEKGGEEQLCARNPGLFPAPRFSGTIPSAARRLGDGRCTRRIATLLNRPDRTARNSTFEG